MTGIKRHIFISLCALLASPAAAQDIDLSGFYSISSSHEWDTISTAQFWKAAQTTGGLNQWVASQRQSHSRLQFQANGSSISRLLSLIAVAEADSRGYDTIHHGATRLPSDLPTNMTVGQVLAWVEATPRQPHAIGRYQFIPSTLRDLMRRGGYSHNMRFSPALQDNLADILLKDAGYDAFTEGRIGRTRFMNNLAKVWAGLPTSTGRSAYDGYAGNRATITWATFDREMASIFRQPTAPQLRF
ncbi:hypothetical protein CLV80_1017 [Yoonia maritima]|uniref:Muramidase (Phage lysozyme) n=1 Tax=Yoonia maritima TaxID=1435347 RepID=A0A2T0W3W9_9RHOB|nr:hypothetical protein [Yoonia maritima]PRY80157.1 hypothetical protein CLV80_1017 [Yoonia maritima]